MSDRWIAEISYRNGESRIVRFEEIEDLHEIIEGGPCFYSISEIKVQIANPSMCVGECPCKS